MTPRKLSERIAVYRNNGCRENVPFHGHKTVLIPAFKYLERVLTWIFQKYNVEMDRSGVCWFYAYYYSLISEYFSTISVLKI